jgi:hypothetical protein
LKYKIKSQLYSDSESQLKGAKQILDDCTWSSCAAAVSWASGYTVDYSAADGVAAEKVALKRIDRQGVSDNGGSLPEAAKVIAKLGGHARYAKSWNDAVDAAKDGAALMVWVQQPIGYPDVRISKWHDVWKRWWTKTDPSHVRDGYGHMTSAGWCADHGWQWACPTRDEKLADEQYAVPVTVQQLRQIANSKVKAGKVGADYKCLLIVTHPGMPKAKAPVVRDAKGDSTGPVEADLPAPEAQKAVQSINTPSHQIDPALAFKVAQAIIGKIEVAKGDKTVREQIVAASLDAIQAALSTAIAVFLGLGVSIFDLSGDGAKAVAASAISAALLVLQRWLDEDNVKYGRTR